jgi:hypothetical protein
LIPLTKYHIYFDISSIFEGGARIHREKELSTRSNPPEL